MSDQRPDPIPVIVLPTDEWQARFGLIPPIGRWMDTRIEGENFIGSDAIYVKGEPA